MRGTQLEVAVLLRFFSLPFLLMGHAVLERKLRHPWSLSLWRERVRTPGLCPFPPKPGNKRGQLPAQMGERPWDPALLTLAMADFCSCLYKPRR